MCVGQTIASKTGAKNVKKLNLITILDKNTIELFKNAII